MIAIINRGAPNKREGKDEGGLRNYEVRINTEVICTFRHFRRDGLACCLRKAAAMVEVKKMKCEECGKTLVLMESDEYWKQRGWPYKLVCECHEFAGKTPEEAQNVFETWKIENAVYRMI